MSSIKVKTLKIKNFKGIKELEVDFTYENNDSILENIIFYGVNGSGKSTILEAIYLTLLVVNTSTDTDKNTKKIENILKDSFLLNEGWIFNHSQEFQINLDFLINNRLNQVELKYHRENGLNLETKSLNKEVLSIYKNFFTYLSSYRLLNPTSVYYAGDWQEIEKIERLAWKDRTRRIYDRPEFSPLSLQFENNYTTIKQYLVNLITDKRVETLSKSNEQILENIKKAFKIFFPKKEFLEKLRRIESHSSYQLMIKNEDGSIVDLDQLSSGEREVIAFFTYLSIRATKASILIIDEPELHLHTEWQAVILYAIHEIFPKCQVFLATHSSEIHQSASQSELFELEKEI